MLQTQPWMSLKDIMVNSISHSWRTNKVWFHFIWYLKQLNSQKEKVEQSYYELVEAKVEALSLVLSFRFSRRKCSGDLFQNHENILMLLEQYT